jgi:hypothetical protein
MNGSGGISGSYNLGVGPSTFTALTSGASNIAMGTSALEVLTTGSNNVILGVNAGSLLTTASNNVAVGRDALLRSTTGFANTVVGYQAGYNNTTGPGNTFVGYLAGRETTTASDNAAFGTNALYYNTTGINNTAIGTTALFFSTTASSNTAVGYQAAYSNVDSTSQTAVGHTALFSLNSSFSGGNTAIGQAAGYSQTSGYSNPYVGYSSGSSMTTGFQNVILGSYNGNQGGLDIRTANNYIVLSDGAGNIGAYCSASANKWSFGGAPLDMIGTARVNIDGSGYATSLNLKGNNITTPAGAYVWNVTTTGNGQFFSFGTEASYTERGSITYNRAGGLTAYNVTSDYRAKDIIGPVTNSGALIDSIPVYMGKMHGATQERPMFIAHETPIYAHTGAKDAVDENGKPVYQQMDASALIPVMWAEIQSLRKRLADAGL